MLVPIGFIFCCQALSAKASFYFLMNNSSTAPVMLFESKQGRRSTKSPQLPQALGVTSCDFVDGLAAGSLTTSAKYEPSKGRQSRCSAARFGVCRKNEFLCANSVTLCVSVVKLPGKTFTTEARSLHREPRRTFSDRLLKISTRLEAK